MLYRLFFRPMAGLALAALLCPVPAALAADAPAAVADSDVHVERANGSFIVDMVIHAPVDVARAWAVLTDFEHMADFVPNLASSQVSERSETLVKVTQKGTAHYGIFSTRFESVREIHLVPMREIRSHGVGGTVQHAESVMQLETDGTGTRLTYHAEVMPGTWVPPLVGPSLVQHQTAEQFSAMVREMLKRP